MNDTAAVAPAFIEHGESISEVPPTAVIDKHKTRYLFYPNDTLQPKRKRRVKRLRHGGDELESDYKCCGITRGVLWRNMFVPMTKGYEYVDPAQIANEKMDTPVIRMGAPNTKHANIERTMYAIEHFPGDEIQGLLFNKSEWALMGLTEIEALRGIEWADFKSQGIQTFFFPEWESYRTRQSAMPYPLSWTRTRIIEAARSTSDSFYQSIADDCLTAIEQAYTWGIEYLKRETKLVKTPASGTGFVAGYSPLAEQLFEFLEQERDDYLRSKDITPFDANSMPVDLKETMDKIAESQAMIAQVLARMNPTNDNSVIEIPAEVKAEVEKMQDVVQAVSGASGLCKALKKNNEPCGAPPKKGSEFCVFHS